MWILIELLVFFGQVLCSVFFLFIIQLKGEFGFNMDPTFTRFKLDALEFYESDIAWFSFIFVMWSMHMFILIRRYSLVQGEDQVASDADIKLLFSAYCLILRSTHLYFLMPFMNEKRENTKFSTTTWAVLGIF